MAVEVTVGILASSLALLLDAARMLTDASLIGLSIVAIRLAQTPREGRVDLRSEADRDPLRPVQRRDAVRAGLLIVYGGITRLVTPPAVTGAAVLVVALIGIVVDLTAT